MSYEEAIFRQNASFWLEEAEKARARQDEQAQLDACKNAEFALDQLDRIKQEEKEVKNAA